MCHWVTAHLYPGSGLEVYSLERGKQVSLDWEHGHGHSTRNGYRMTTYWMINGEFPTLFLSVCSQNASNHTFPSTQEIGESSVKNLTGKRKDPNVETSETPPRSRYSKVQIQDAHLYTTAFRQLFSLSLSLSKTHYLWLTWNQRECLWCQWETKTNGGKATRNKQIQCKKRYPSPQNLSVSSTIKDNFLSIK